MNEQPTDLTAPLERADGPTPAEPDRPWHPEVIDLTGLDDIAGRTSPPPVGGAGPSAPAVRVRLERGDDPFAGLDEQARMRLIIRVLCELVAYGELPAQPDTAS